MRGGQNERTYGPATSFGKIVSEDQDDSWDRSVQGMVEPRGVVSKSGIAKGWKPAASPTVGEWNNTGLEPHQSCRTWGPSLPSGRRQVRTRVVGASTCLPSPTVVVLAAAELNPLDHVARSVGAMPKTQEAVVRRRWRPGLY